MKKILSAILSVCVIASAAPLGYAQFSDVSDSEAIDVITGIGVMEGYSDGTFLPDNNLTRAEFAQIISNIYRFGAENDILTEWKQNFFEGIFDETALIPPEVMNAEDAQLFTDVSSSNDYYNAIELVATRGIMVGVGGGMFDPDGNITVEQALKVVVAMMGYSYQASVYGGFPTGYVRVANERKLTTGLKNYSAYATRADIAQIIYNALDVELMQLIPSGSDMTYKTVAGETFLLKFLGMKHDKGRMTDNGYTGFLGLSTIDERNVVINGGKYEISDNTEYVRDFIGRDVLYYYSVEDDTEAMVWAKLSGRDEAVEINIKDFIEMTDSSVRYYENDGGREKVKSIKKAPFVIKNGSAVASISPEDLDFNYGTVTVVSPAKSSTADLIIIKSYTNFYVTYTDADKGVIYSSASKLGTEIAFGDDTEMVARIYDAAGNITSINSIQPSSIATISLGEKIVEIHISDKTVNNFNVYSTAYNDDGELVVYNTNNDRYVLSKDYTDLYPEDILKLGYTYNLKLDMFGNIAWFKTLSKVYNLAFLNNVRTFDDDDTGEEVVRLTYFDITTRKIGNSYLADKVKIIARDDKAKTYRIKEGDLSAAFDVLDEYMYSDVPQYNDDADQTFVKSGDDLVMTPERTGGVFRYQMDDYGRITEVELAGEYENTTDNTARLVEIPLNHNKVSVHNDERENFYNGQTIVGGKIIVTNETMFLHCNYTDSENFEREKGYSIENKSSYNENHGFYSYTTKAYSMEKNSPIATLVVETVDPSGRVAVEDERCAVVTNIEEKLNDDDEQRKFITLNSTEYEIEEEVFTENKIKNASGETEYVDGNGVKHPFTIEKGDLIKYGFNASGVINQIMLIYDANADYSNGVMIQGTVYDGYSKRGNLAGGVDGYHSEVPKNSNPFSSDNNASFSPEPIVWADYSGRWRTQLACAIRMDNGYLITTSRNLQENPGEVGPDDPVYAQDLWNASSFTLITIGKKRVTVTPGQPLSTLRTYSDVGTKCDRILIRARLGNVRNFYVIRYDD